MYYKEFCNISWGIIHFACFSNSYMAEHVVGTGSFGVVYEALNSFSSVSLNVRSDILCFTFVSVFVKLLFLLIHNALNVLQAKCLETGEAVAIKKVLQDKRYKNRELQVTRMLEHTDVFRLKRCFYSTAAKDEVYLNLVLQYVPETVYRVSKQYARMHQYMPIFLCNYIHIR